MTVYVFGHKSPDTDCTCASIAYAALKQRAGTNAEAVRIGELNPETLFVLEKFGVEEPALLESAEGKEVILIDHNEKVQSIDDLDKAEVVEIIDHHKVSINTDKPIFIRVEPVGSTSTIIADMYFQNNAQMDKKTAGILLASILSDTVVFKSPTTTDKDKAIAQRLAGIAGINDLRAFGVEVKKAKADIRDRSPRDIILSDFKEYDLPKGKIFIGQIEVVDANDALEMKQQLLKEMESLKKERNLSLISLMVTDIMKEATHLLVIGEEDKVEKAFNTRVQDGIAFLNSVMSRKKQVVPPLKAQFE
jgi:manganese-dependent inorganic pyrophosphatase